jgi:hypothetical protein
MSETTPETAMVAPRSRQSREDAMIMGVMGMLPAVATVRTRTCTRTTRVRTSRWVDTARHMWDIQEGMVVPC